MSNTDREQASAVGTYQDASRSNEASPADCKSRRRRRRRRCLICGGCCAGVLVVIAVVILVLALTVFRVKDPVMTLNNISIQRLSLSTGAASLSPALAINMTVVADVSVKNPNAASVRFDASTTSLYYREREMGVAQGPPGTAPARRSFRINVTVDVMADRILGDADLLAELVAGSIAVTTSTKVGGRVRVLGVLRRHVDVMMNCSITVAVANQSIVQQSCRRKVRL